MGDKILVFFYNLIILYSIIFISGTEAVSTSSSESFETADIFHRLQIYTENAPKPVGPYSQAIQFGRTVYVSAMLGLDKETKKLVPGGAEAEAKQALENLSAILDEANTHFANVVRTTVYLHDMNDFMAVNRQYKEYFRHPYPARTTLEVSKLPLNLSTERVKCGVLNLNNGDILVQQTQYGAKVAIEAVVGLCGVQSQPEVDSTSEVTSQNNQSLTPVSHTTLPPLLND